MSCLGVLCTLFHFGFFRGQPPGLNNEASAKDCSFKSANCRVAPKVSQSPQTPVYSRNETQRSFVSYRYKAVRRFMTRLHANTNPYPNDDTWDLSFSVYA